MTSFSRIDKLSPDTLRYTHGLVWLYMLTNSIDAGLRTDTRSGGTAGNKVLKLSPVQRRAPLPYSAQQSFNAFSVRLTGLQWKGP